MFYLYRYAIRSLCDNLYDEVAAETAQLIAPPLIEMLRDPQSDYEFKVFSHCSHLRTQRKLSKLF